MFSLATQCIDVHYIEFSEERLFMEPTFRSRVSILTCMLNCKMKHLMLKLKRLVVFQVFSIGIRDQSLPSTANPIVYRIHGNNDLSPSDEE